MGRFKEFIKWYFHVDLKDITNYIALIIAMLLLWWGLKTIVASLTMSPVP